jgi:hypothetical protein
MRAMGRADEEAPSRDGAPRVVTSDVVPSVLSQSEAEENPDSVPT